MRLKISRLPQREFLSRGFGVSKTPYFSLKVKKNEVEKNRIGAVVGKAVHKSAVRRNFLKRQAMEGLANIIRPGTDLLIIFSSPVNKLKKNQLREEIIKAAKHLY